MCRPNSRLWTVWGALLASIIFADPVHGQVAIAGVRSIDEVKSCAAYLSEMTGSAMEVKAFTEFVQFSKGVDPARPFGAALYLPTTPGKEPTVVFFVPFAKMEDLKALVGRYQTKLVEQPDGSTRLRLADGKELAVRYQKGYAFFIDNSDFQVPKLFDPTMELKFGAGQIVDAHLFVDRVPDGYQKYISTQLKDLAKKFPKEDPLDYQVAQLLAQGIDSEWLGAVFAQTRLDFSLSYDKKEHRVTGELLWTPKAGSVKHAVPASLESKTRYLTKGAIFSAAGRTAKTAGESGPSVDEIVDKYLKDFINMSADAKTKLFGRDLTEAMKSMTSPDGQDYAIALVGPDGNNMYTIVSAFHLKGGRKLERALRDVVKNAKGSEMKGVKMDVEDYSGTNIHRETEMGELLGIGMNMLGMKQPIGKCDVYLGIRDDCVFITIGEAGLKQMKLAIDGWKGAAIQVKPQEEVDIALARFLGLWYKDKRMPEKYRKLFPTETSDRVRYVQWETGIRIDVSALLLRIVTVE